MRPFAGGGRGGIWRLAAAAALAAGLAGPGEAQSPQAAESEIRAALETWRSAFNDRDQDKVCDLFAPDLVANYQGEPERDYASLCQLLHSALQDSDTTYHYSLRINEILVYGEMAIARLVWTLDIDRTGAAREVIDETSVDIFRRQPDSSWKISRYLAYPAQP